MLKYLVDNPLLALFLCLGLGYLIGNIKIKSFSFGATASTLLVGIVLSLFAKSEGAFQISKDLQNCFYGMFAFTLGYDVGPAFFRALRSSGIRVVILAAVHAVCAGVFIWLTCLLFGFHADVGVGLLAGAFTFTAASASVQSTTTSLIYTLTYALGTVSAIVFVRFLAPGLLRTDLLQETKRYLDSQKTEEPVQTLDCGVLQIRALQILPGSPCDGKTVDQVEGHYGYRLEIETVIRGDQRIPAHQKVLLRHGDVLTVIGDVAALSACDDLGLEEVAEPRYFQVRQQEAQIVLTTGLDQLIRERLTNYGILVRCVHRGGKLLKNPADTDLQEGDILEVYGPEMAIKEVAATLGYLKDNGITTDIPAFSLALAVGLALAGVGFMMMGRPVTLGISFGTLVAGLICGWWYDRSPRFGHIADSTRWFIKSIGLNVYIAIAGLTSELTLADLLSPNNFLYIVLGIILTILVRTVVLLIGKYALKLDHVELLGGICGSATSTPALNALTEHTGSTAYALSYAPGYAVGNVLLILTGIVLANIIP